MDNKRGQFEPIDEQTFKKQMEEPKPYVFKEGEILEIRGSRFRVDKIIKKKLILKLLSQTPTHLFRTD